MTTLGDGELQFTLVENWPRTAPNAEIVEAVGVAVDSQDRVYVFNRGGVPVLVFDADGNPLKAWGEGEFERPHGIWIDQHDTLYLSDDLGHRVVQYTIDGQRMRAIGPEEDASETGVEGFDYRKITRGEAPYNLPTNAVTNDDGQLFVTDGYGNARVHHFSSSGELIKSWGEPGDAAGHFNVPHGIGIDSAGLLYVADRENSRIQIFSQAGELVSTWTDVIRPCEVFVSADGLVYVAELGRRAGLFPWFEVEPDAVGGRLSIFDREGRLLTRWGGGADPLASDGFYAPHDLWVDSQGSLYVSEVAVSAAKLSGDDSSGWPTLRKYRLASRA